MPWKFPAAPTPPPPSSSSSFGTAAPRQLRRRVGDVLAVGRDGEATLGLAGGGDLSQFNYWGSGSSSQTERWDPNDPNYCDCGWPYTLLLPRSTEDGMTFRLAVFCTDGGRDEKRAELMQPGRCRIRNRATCEQRADHAVGEITEREQR